MPMKTNASVALLMLLMACGRSSKDHKTVDGSDRNNTNCVVNCDPGSTNPGSTNQPIVPPAQPSNNSQANKDKTSPRVTAFRQIGLEALELEFSEPIKISNIRKDTSVFGTMEWSVDRTKMRAPFDRTKLPEFGFPSLYIDSIADDAGNDSRLNLQIPVDCLAPSIQLVKRIDATTIDIIFNEDVNIPADTEVVLNQIYKAEPLTLQSADKTIRFKTADAAALASDAGVISISGLTDIYGNVAKRRAGRYVSSTDKDAPVITSITQQPSEMLGNVPYVVFKMEFSEYVIDARDSNEDGGTLGELGSLLDSLGSFTLNDESLFFFEAKWTRAEDHRSLVFKLPVYGDLKHMKQNTIGLDLMDISGNKALRTFTFTPDVFAPSFLGRYSDQTQCFMQGTRSFRCQLTEGDVASAQLLPESDWPKNSYSTRVTEDTTGETPSYWLHFDFTNDIPEKAIMSMDIIDNHGNHSANQSNLFLFLPISKKSEFQSLNAFGLSILEVQMSGGVGSIDEVRVDGKSQRFALISEDELQSYGPSKSVMIQFKEPLALGDHDVELIGIRRLRNPELVTERVVLKKISNVASDIIQSSIKERSEFNNVLSLELSQPLKGQQLDIFVRLSFADEETQETQLQGFKVEEEAVSRKGTWPIRVTLSSAVGLNSNQHVQPIVFQIKGRKATSVQRIALSTMEPEFKLSERSSSRTSFTFTGNHYVEISSLKIELIDSEGLVLPVKSEWLKVEERFISLASITVNLPEDKALTPGKYKFRITAGKSQGLGVSISEPYEATLTVK